MEDIKILTVSILIDAFEKRSLGENVDEFIKNRLCESIGHYLKENFDILPVAVESNEDKDLFYQRGGQVTDYRLHLNIISDEQLEYYKKLDDFARRYNVEFD